MVLTGVSLFATVDGPGKGDRSEGSLCLSLRLVDRKAQTVASWFAGERNAAWWVRAKTDPLLANGSSWHEARLRQTGDKFEPWPTATPSEPTVALPPTEGGHLSVLTVAGGDIRTLVGSNDFEGAAQDPDPGEPFAGQRANAVPYLPLDLPEAPIPDWLTNIAAPPLCDMRPTVAKCGVAFGEDEMLAYDFMTGRLVCGCRNPEKAEMVKTLFAQICPGFHYEIEYETWLEDAAIPGRILARASLVCLSGTKGCIEWKGAGKPSSSVSLEGEFALDSPGGACDARTSFNGNSVSIGAKNMEWMFNAPASLGSGIPLLMDALRLPDGRTVRRGQKSVNMPIVNP